MIFFTVDTFFVDIMICQYDKRLSIKAFVLIAAYDYSVFPNRIGYLFLWIIIGRSMISIVNAMMKHSDQSYVMSVMWSVFSMT